MAGAFPFSQRVVDIIAQGNFMAVYACQLDFPDGMVFAHTGTGDLVLDGITYQGVGSFGEVGEAQESSSSGSPMSVDLTPQRPGHHDHHGDQPERLPWAQRQAHVRRDRPGRWVCSRHSLQRPDGCGPVLIRRQRQ